MKNICICQLGPANFCKLLLQTIFLQTLDLGFFVQFITIAILDKLFANFASWGFQTNLQGGRGGQVGQGEHLTGFMLYSMLHFENFSEFDFHLTRERGTRRSPWNSRPGTLPFVPCLNFLCWKTFSFCAFPFLWSARTSCSTQDQSFCSYAPKN